MKTPREVLLEQHQKSEAKLDRVRRAAVAVAQGKSVEIPGQSLAEKLPAWIWNELILPYKLVWSGLATVWVGILGLNFATPDVESEASAKARPTQSVQVMIALSDNKRMLSDLLDRPLPATSLKPSILKPRTEIHVPIAAC